MTQNRTPDCLPDDLWPVGKRAAALTATVAFGLGLFDFIDRQVMAALIPFIKADWHLTDTEVGMLISIVNIAIPVLVIPSAWLIDRWSRKKMLAIMGTIWSLATGACALAGSYGHLLVARFFIGAGEAGYNPAAVPLLSAVFPKKWRGTAVSITQVGMSLGVPVGTLLGAFIATHWGWRHAFGIVMLPGLLLAVMALFITDYKNAPAEKNAGKASPSMLSAVGKLLKTPSLLLVFVGAIMIQLFNGTIMNWLPSYFMREGRLSPVQGSALFSVVVLASITSIAVGGLLLDFARRRRANGLPLITTAGLLAGTVLLLVAFSLLAPAGTAQLVCLAAGLFLSMGVMVNGSYLAVVELAQPDIRATATSLMIFLQNIFGFAVGPLLTGILSDHFSLGTAMQVLSLAPALAGLGMAICCFTWQRDQEKTGCHDVTF